MGLVPLGVLAVPQPAASVELKHVQRRHRLNAVVRLPRQPKVVQATHLSILSIVLGVLAVLRLVMLLELKHAHF